MSRYGRRNAARSRLTEFMSTRPNPAARQWTHRLFAGIREFAITTIGLALVHAVLWWRPAWLFNGV
jgi:hypothetical protein